MYRDDERNKCCFFKRYDGNTIWCEGVTGQSTTKQSFYSKKAMEKYINKHCRCNYKDCMIYQMLEQKYQ